MRCAVKNCNNNNKSKPCKISFFSFPSDTTLLKQWQAFCCREMNPKTSSICMEHFKPEDFENNLEFEMGFTKRRFLKQGVVPSVKKTHNSELSKQRAQRIEKRENNKIVERLLDEYDAAIVPDQVEHGTQENVVVICSGTERYEISMGNSNDDGTRIPASFQNNTTNSQIIKNGPVGLCVQKQINEYILPDQEIAHYTEIPVDDIVKSEEQILEYNVAAESCNYSSNRADTINADDNNSLKTTLIEKEVTTMTTQQQDNTTNGQVGPTESNVKNLNTGDVPMSIEESEQPRPPECSGNPKTQINNSDQDSTITIQTEDSDDCVIINEATTVRKDAMQTKTKSGENKNKDKKHKKLKLENRKLKKELFWLKEKFQNCQRKKEKYKKRYLRLKMVKNEKTI